MAKTQVMQTFTKGMSGDASPFVLDLSQCASVTNMLFERGLLISRPGLTSIESSTPVNTLPVAAFSGFLHPAVIGQTLTVLHTPSVGAAVHVMPVSAIKATMLQEFPEYTGPAITKYTTLPIGAPLAAFNDVAVVPGFNEGIIRIGTFTYTIPLAQAYLFCTTHLSRVLLACNISLLGGGLRQIAWSKIGDETVWSGTYDSGSVILQEADDGITGLGVIKNVVVVPRTSGFHLGFPTGDGTNPYDWKCISRNEVGCYYPPSFAVYGGKCYFVSDSHVHTFDLSSVEDIGEGIVTELFEFVQQYGMSIQGVITRTYKLGYRPQYHLMPVYIPSNPFAAPVFPEAPPHFVFDITEQKWSRHTYTQPGAYPRIPFALNYVQYANNTQLSIQRSAPAFLTPPAVGQHFTYDYWDPSVPCEGAMSATTGRVQLGDSIASEYSMLRMMLVVYLSTPRTLTVRVTSQLGGDETTTTYTVAATKVGWQRVWVDGIKVGQFFQFTIEFPAATQVALRQVIVVHEVQAQEVRI